VESLSAGDATLRTLADAVLHGKTQEALEAIGKALVDGYSLEDIVVKGVLKAHLEFGEWYDRDPLDALKAWEFCFFTTVKILKALDSKIPAPQNAPLSVLVMTVKGEGHITMRDVIALLLKSKGLKVYSSRKGITLEDVSPFLQNRSLKVIVLSCTEDGTKMVLDKLVRGVRAARPDIRIVASGQFAGFSGADVLLQDPTKLYDTLMGLQRV
jgi:methanogenic corrinoid protein MtbC1